MKFQESISHGFKNYAEFDGRSSRSSFWWWYLFTFIVGVVLAIVKFVLEVGLDLLIPLSTIWLVVTFLPSFSYSVRRAHDVNKSGWWTLVPYYNIYILCQKGTIGENRFGAAPLSLVR